MVDRKLYFAEVVDTGEIFYFYIVQDISYDEPQSIVQKVAPFTAAGRTQNLGRMPISISKTLMLVDSRIEGKFESKEETMEKILRIKRKRQKVKLIIPGLPLSSTTFFIGNFSETINEPNRLMVTLEFKEILEDNIQTTTQNLVLSDSMENIEALLEQRGLI